MATSKLPPVHPGEILQNEFLIPLGLSQYRLAKDTSVPPRRINEIVRGQRAISADTALRLARFFGTTAQLWMNLQTRYDLETARKNQRVRRTPRCGRLSCTARRQGRRNRTTCRSRSSTPSGNLQAY